MSVVTSGSSHDPVTRRLPPGVDRLPSGGFRARVTVNGRQRSLGTFPNATAAGRAAERARADLAQGGWIDPRRSAISLDGWMDEWMPNRPVRPYTRTKDTERYRVHIKPWLGSMQLVKLTPYQIQKWLTILGETRNPATIRKAHTLLKTALGVRGAIGDQRLAVNPCLIVQPPKVGRPDWVLLTRPEFERLLTHIPERWQPLVITAAFTGLRPSELAALERTDFNPLTKTLSVTKSLDWHGQVQPTKNRQHRTIPLTPRVLTLLNAHAPAEGRLFTGARGGTLTNFTQRIWQPACEKAGLTARFYDLRHSCASWLLAGGASLAEVRDLLGHSSITVTELYLHVDRDGLSDTVQRAFG